MLLREINDVLSLVLMSERGFSARMKMCGLFRGWCKEMRVGFSEGSGVVPE